MNLFLRNVCVQIIGLLLILLVADYYFSQKIKKNKAFAIGDCFIWSEIFSGHIDDDILIYGSSRAWTHFNSNIIQDSLGLTTYNLGIDGYHFRMQYFRHKMVIKYNEKPKLIIVSLDAFSLDKRENLYNMNQFLPFIYHKDIRDFTFTYSGFSIQDYSIPMYRYFSRRSVLKDALFKDDTYSNEQNFRHNGFRGVEREWNDDLKKAKAKLGKYVAKVDQSSVDLLNVFLNECRYLDIDVVLVYSPEYIEGQNFIKNRKNVVEIYTDISKTYGIPFMDYSNDSICENRDMFYNSMHLNAKGSQLFSEKFASDLKHLKLFERI